MKWGFRVELCETTVSSAITRISLLPIGYSTIDERVKAVYNRCAPRGEGGFRAAAFPVLN